VTFPYCWLRQAHWSIAVKPDSPIKSIAELKGKNIGIRNRATPAISAPARCSRSSA
jgi:ABC-type nitrate/sulfonate/bicarbonate transport system substrate-binding protein